MTAAGARSGRGVSPNGKSIRVAALLYHHVGPVTEEACRGLTVMPDAFTRQITVLSAMGYQSIYPEDWVAWVRGERDIPERAVMITFDDGYADLPVHAFPVLERNRFGCTVFIPSALIGKKIECNPEHTTAVLPIMSAAEIRVWAGRGVRFGAHSRTHTDLTTLPESGMRQEVTKSRDDLSAITGQHVTSFAYPYGRYNSNVVTAVEQAYMSAFTIGDGLNDATTPLLMLKRTMVQHRDTLLDVCLRARYGKSIFERARTAAITGLRGRTAPANA